jgi:hypothetical protein
MKCIACFLALVAAPLMSPSRATVAQLSARLRSSSWLSRFRSPSAIFMGAGYAFVDIQA